MRQHRSHLRRRTGDCGCVWTTELSIKHIRNAYHLIQTKEGDEYQTELNYESEQISRRQNNDI
jgi:hypothetical protein